MEISEIVGLCLFCVFIVAFIVLFIWLLYNDYAVYSYDGLNLCIRNSFSTYKILEIRQHGVWVSSKNGRRFINASRITHFWVLACCPKVIKNEV